MAKKRFNVSSTLSKNKSDEMETPALANKIPLRKSTKDIDLVKEKVEEIHTTPSTTESNTKKRSNPSTARVAKTKEPEKEKIVRLTIDTPESVHRKLKVQSVLSGMSMRDYILKLLEKDLKKVNF